DLESSIISLKINPPEFFDSGYFNTSGETRPTLSRMYPLNPYPNPPISEVNNLAFGYS
ncbi:unnamed protein product, partial [marine sediment metagenome]